MNEQEQNNDMADLANAIGCFGITMIVAIIILNCIF